MLEMCRNLEDENATLTETVNSLKEQLAEAKRESAASQLIPHYRLAIVRFVIFLSHVLFYFFTFIYESDRSRTYAANLLEQLRREQVIPSHYRTMIFFLISFILFLLG